MEPTHPVDEGLQALRDEREARIRELEVRTTRRRPRRGSRFIGWGAMLLAGAVAWQERFDLGYLISPRAPVALGRPGEYRWERLEADRYVQIHGQPTSHAVWAKQDGRTFVLVGLVGTPILVRRPPLSTEHWIEGAPPPPPDPRPFAVGGRLVPQQRAGAYGPAFDELFEKGEVLAHQGRAWLLLEGERPGEDWQSPLWVASLLVLGAWSLFRRWTVRT